MTAPVSRSSSVSRVPPPRSRSPRISSEAGLIVAPALVAVCGAVWGLNGALSALFGIGLVLVNFALVRRRSSPRPPGSRSGIMMGAVLFGYLIRLGLILVAVLLVKDASWISRPASAPPSSSRTWAPRLGAQVRRHLARPPWAQARSPLTR